MTNKTKIRLGIIGFLLLLIGIGAFYHNSIINSLEDELSSVRDEKKVELKELRDSLTTVNVEMIAKSKIRFDSIVNLPPKVKYIKYVKTIYSDRTVDSNLDILANE